MKHQLSILIGLSMILSLLACEQEPTNKYFKQVDLEVFVVKLENGEATKGAMSFKESIIEDPEGKEVEHWYYNRNNQLTSFEKYEFEEGSELAKGSKFFDQKDSLLSYYQFDYDDKGNRVKSYAYDASNDELLKVESFGYDQDQNRIWREIHSAGGQLVRRYEFRFDKNGNESSYTVFDGEKNPLFGEAFTITKSDKEEGWVEQWSWRDDKPSTIKTRTIRRFIPTEK